MLITQFQRRKRACTLPICPVFGRVPALRKSLSFDVAFAQFLLGFANPVKDAGEADVQICLGRPGQLLSGFAIVGPIEDDIALTRIVRLCDGGIARTNLLHGRGGFAERN